MLRNSQHRDPYQLLRRFIELVETKCRELPTDIDHWIEMAGKHDPKSKTHSNIIQSSVKPREAYLITIQKLHASLMEALALIENKEDVESSDIHLDMPIETMIRKYLQSSEKLRMQQKIINHLLIFLTHYWIEFHLYEQI